MGLLKKGHSTRLILEEFKNMGIYWTIQGEPHLQPISQQFKFEQDSEHQIAHEQCEQVKNKFTLDKKVCEMDVM